MIILFLKHLICFGYLSMKAASLNLEILGLTALEQK